MNEARTLLHIQNGESVHGVVAGLHHLGPTIVALTDGANGAYAFDGTSLVFAPAFPGERVEATGAGDAFSSGFLGAMLHNLSVDDAVRFGSANAASVITQVGPTAGLRTFADLKKALENNPTYKTKTL